MAGTIIVDRIESDASYASSINVAAQVTFSNTATFKAGTAALPSITTAGDTNTGIFFPAADTIAFAEGGAEVVRIDSNGNLGIGTVSPGRKLSLKGNDVWHKFEETAGSGRSWLIGTGTGTNFRIYDETAALDRMAVDTSGNLQFNSGYGSVATGYGCRAWVNFNGTTAVTNASGNITSVTRTAAGTFTVAFTTAMPDANYVVVGTASSTQFLRAVQTSTSATGSVVVRTIAENATAVDTSGNVHIAIFR